MACAPWLLGAYTANIRLIPGIQTRESYEGGDFDQYVARLKDLQVREPEEIPEPTFAPVNDDDDVDDAPPGLELATDGKGGGVGGQD